MTVQGSIADTRGFVVTPLLYELPSNAISGHHLASAGVALGAHVGEDDVLCMRYIKQQV